MTPVLIAINEDITDINFDNRVILAPISLSWIMLLPALMINTIYIKKYHNEVKNL